MANLETTRRVPFYLVDTSLPTLFLLALFFYGSYSGIGSYILAVHALVSSYCFLYQGYFRNAIH